ncbi:DUF6538 domain-containing protein [Noviherbaspirillum sp.]|uniref:DUF6538 domain-containing protein n=1 Tax=Noviherbaspirillum sp. TaxID=1926288 RepID=UPI002B47630B|nr:DUF6538 domain-containing protein [Noviherbaspirillum sp.]HJV82417.1 DUF6538 domain-containing protein [Noviherbaspirillum sp.]
MYPVGVTPNLKRLMCTHLAKRGSRYYFRRKIPLDLLPHYKGREVMRSLGTSDTVEEVRGNTQSGSLSSCSRQGKPRRTSTCTWRA